MCWAAVSHLQRRLLVSVAGCLGYDVLVFDDDCDDV